MLFLRAHQTQTDYMGIQLGQALHILDCHSYEARPTEPVFPAPTNPGGERPGSLISLDLNLVFKHYNKSACTWSSSFPHHQDFWHSGDTTQNKTGKEEPCSQNILRAPLQLFLPGNQASTSWVFHWSQGSWKAHPPHRPPLPPHTHTQWELNSSQLPPLRIQNTKNTEGEEHPALIRMPS